MLSARPEDEAHYVYGRLIETVLRSVDQGQNFTVHVEQMGVSEAAISMLTERFAKQDLRAELVGDVYRIMRIEPTSELMASKKS